MDDLQKVSIKEGLAISYEKILRSFINLNIIFILLPETLIWIVFTNFNIALSPAHKLFLLALFLLYLLSVPSRRTEQMFLLFILFFLSSVLSAVYFHHAEFLFVSIAEICRLLILFAAYYYCRYLVESKKIDIIFFSKLIWVSFYIISINLLLGALGLGNQQRAMGIGTRGFFNAGNDIASITIVIAPFILSEKYEKGWASFLLYFLFFFFLAYLLNTKATLIGLVIIALLLPAYGNVKARLPQRVFTRLVYIVFFFPIAIAAGLIFLTRINFWERYLTFMHQFKGESWITFLLSRRDEHLAENLDFVSSNFGIINYVFGYGPGDFLSQFPFRAEIDPFEIFFYYGIVGLLLVYWWFLKHVRRSYNVDALRGTRLFIFSRGLFIANIILLLQSLIAGHVFMSVLVCIFLGSLNAISYLKQHGAH
jgi:hypothetical protein